MPCPHQQEIQVFSFSGVEMVKRPTCGCQLLIDMGLPLGFPPAHCERCLADVDAPGTLDAEINQRIMQHAIGRRIENWNRESKKFLTLEQAITEAKARYSQQWLEDQLVKAVRRGMPPAQAQELAGS